MATHPMFAERSMSRYSESFLQANLFGNAAF